MKILFISINNISILMSKVIGITKFDEIPFNTIEIKFYCSYNEPLEKSLGKLEKIKIITFGNYFNQDVSNLPLGITHLTFGENFNQDVSNLPLGLTHLTFGKKFNKQVDYLPLGIIYLEFGNDFNQTIDNLPIGIEHIILGDNFSKSIDNLPNNIKYIKMSSDYIIKNIEINKLPNKLENIKFDSFTFDNNFIKNIKQLKSSINLFELKGEVGPIGPPGISIYFAEATLQ